jgi:carbon starvation protein CstA
MYWKTGKARRNKGSQALALVAKKIQHDHQGSHTLLLLLLLLLLIIIIIIIIITTTTTTTTTTTSTITTTTTILLIEIPVFGDMTHEN